MAKPVSSSGNPLAWLLDLTGLRRIEQSLAELHKKVDKMATYAEVKQEWVDYTVALQTENATLRQATADAQAAAQANAEALQAFQDDDAATDAQQLADQAQAIADDLKSTLDGLKPPPVEPEPLPVEPPVEPPVDEQVGPTTPPEGEEPQVNPL